MTEEEFVFGGDSTDIPPGTYPAKLAAMGVKQSDQYGDFRTWDFTLDNGSAVGGASSMATSSKSKGGRWGRALLGHDPKKGEKAVLIGRPCLVVVGLDKNDWPTVVDVLPPLASPVSPQPASPGPAAAAPQAEPAGPLPNMVTEADSDELPF
jgi:hypothetical protein